MWPLNIIWIIKSVCVCVWGRRQIGHFKKLGGTRPTHVSWNLSPWPDQFGPRQSLSGFDSCPLLLHPARWDVVVLWPSDLPRPCHVPSFGCDLCYSLHLWLVQMFWLISVYVSLWIKLFAKLIKVKWITIITYVVFERFVSIHPKSGQRYR